MKTVLETPPVEVPTHQPVPEPIPFVPAPEPQPQPSITEQRVERGVKWLDKTSPGWEWAIDLRQLAMWDCKRCMMGQLFPEQDVDFTRPIQVARGFALPLPRGVAYFPGDKEWSVLGQAWKHAIIRRRAVDKLIKSTR